MFSVFSRHKAVSIIGSILILLATIGFNLYYITTPNTGGQLISEEEVNQNLPGYVPDSNSGGAGVAQSTSFNYLPILITAGILVIGFIGVFIALKISDRKQKQQDAQYKEHLSALAATLETYATAKGSYPKSLTYSPEHYTGIHLGKEWGDYGFPNDDEMRQYSPQWPHVDASKLDQILYFVRENGAQFDLFAQVKTLAKDEVKDYNKEYDLPKAWGDFNYRIGGRGIQMQPATTQIPPATKEAPGAAIANPVVQQPLSSPSQVVPAASIQPEVSASLPTSTSSPVQAATGPVPNPTTISQPVQLEAAPPLTPAMTTTPIQSEQVMAASSPAPAGTILAPASPSAPAETLPANLNTSAEIAPILDPILSSTTEAKQPAPDLGNPSNPEGSI